MDKEVKEHYRYHYFKMVARENPDWLHSQIVKEVDRLMAERESGKKPKIRFTIVDKPKEKNVKPYIF